jgi:endonuclease III
VEEAPSIAVAMSANKCPPRWKEQLAGIKEMRAIGGAPVDTQGCDRLSTSADPKRFRFEVLVAAFLSSQTKDPVAAVERLKEKGLSVEYVLCTSEKDLEELIYPVGFYRTKAKNLKKLAQVLRLSHDDDVPNDLSALLALPGIGPKMAYLILQCAWDKYSGAMPFLKPQQRGCLRRHARAPHLEPVALGQDVEEDT